MSLFGGIWVWRLWLMGRDMVVVLMEMARVLRLGMLGWGLVLR